MSFNTKNKSTTIKKKLHKKMFHKKGPTINPGGKISSHEIHTEFILVRCFLFVR